MWVRIPGSFNGKGVEKGIEPVPVTLLQEWDGQIPYINWLLRDFRNYLIEKQSNFERR